MTAIQIEHLQKRYGQSIGTQDVTFSVVAGELFGFVGPNGAGKSTTLKILMGLIFPDGGSAAICGLDAVRESRRIKTFTGYVPADVRLYPAMRVGELLRRNAGFYEGDITAETARLSTLFGLDAGKRFSTLSTGNKKKVSIACALAPQPKVIILDEPTSGLDPVMQRTLFEELKRQTARGATVLLSSHNLAEVQEYCRRVAFIRDGRILTVADLAEAAAPRKVITALGGGEAPVGLELVSAAEEGRRVFRTALSGDGLLEALAILAPDDFTVAHESIEERFWSLYGGEEQP